MAKTKNSRKAGSATMSEVEFQQTVKLYVDNQTQINQKNSEMEAEIAAIRKKYEPEITHLDEIQDEKFKAIKNFCLVNKDKFFAKKRSIQVLGATLGLRQDPPSVKPDKGQTWEKALELIKQNLPGYIRTVEQPDKDKILADRSSIAHLIPKAGLRIVQEDQFLIKCEEKETDNAVK
jgi:phage host-nuclease inhibitor protein Gam